MRVTGRLRLIMKYRLSFIDRELAQFKDHETPKIILFLAIASLCSLPISIYRIILTEAYNLNSVLHLTIYAAVAIVFWFRQLATYKTIVYLLLYCSLMMCYTEFSDYAFMGVGEITAMLAVLLAVFHLGKRMTTIIIILVSLFYFSAMYQYVYLDKSLLIPAEQLKGSGISWTAIYVNALIFFILIGLCTTIIYQKMILLGAHLTEQNNKIEAQNKRIEFLANHDALTGLPSLRLAGERLDQAISAADKGDHKAALLFLDLDGFKLVNDTHGHEAGDRLLQIVSERIDQATSANDTVCRIGGDEFLVIIGCVESYQHIEKVCSDLIAVINEPIDHKESQLFVGASIGAATYPCFAKDAKSLRAKADELMYEVKRSGKNSYRIATSKDRA